MAVHNYSALGSAFLRHGLYRNIGFRRPDDGLPTCRRRWLTAVGLARFESSQLGRHHPQHRLSFASGRNHCVCLSCAAPSSTFPLPCVCHLDLYVLQAGSFGLFSSHTAAYQTFFVIQGVIGACRPIFGRPFIVSVGSRSGRMSFITDHW
jgi:hypothetical protein